MAIIDIHTQPKKMEEINISGEDLKLKKIWLSRAKYIRASPFNRNQYLIVGYAHGWLKQYQLFDILRQTLPSSWVTYVSQLKEKSERGETIEFEGNTYKYSELNPEIEIVEQIIAAYTGDDKENVDLVNNFEELMSNFSYSAFENFINKYTSKPETAGLRKRKLLQANNQNLVPTPSQQTEPVQSVAAVLVQKGVIDGKKDKSAKEIRIAEKEQEENKEYMTKRLTEISDVRKQRRKETLMKKRQQQLEQIEEQPLQEPKKVDTKPEAHQTQAVPSDSEDKPKTVTVPGRLLHSMDGIDVSDIRRWLTWFRKWSIEEKANGSWYHIPTEQEIQQPDANRWKVITPEEVKLFKMGKITNKVGTVSYLYGIVDYQLYIYATQLLSKDIMVYDATK